MNEYIKFLQDHLSDVHRVEFAVAALPANAASERVFHCFTKKADTLTTTDGYTLTIQPFPDDQHVKPRTIPSVKDHYLTITQKAIDTIHAGMLEKVVLARTKRLEEVARESLIPWYERLLEKYPAAFVFIVSTKEDGIWIGASPELLVEKNHTNFHTIALAATSKSIKPHWSEKDYEEHTQVVSYLAKELERPYIKNIIFTEPYTVRYGALSHLETDVSFTSTMSLRRVTKLIHPTPALCGFPKDIALIFIQENEAEPRSFYTGSMTVEDAQGDGVSYAFLRCARLSDASGLTMFAGCGIVGASVPRDEWEESEAKASSVLDLL
jgi:isochorismate synthase